MDIWNFIFQQLNSAIVTLLYVLESNGSSPGRKGFLMAVNAQGDFRGTIGGGIMEVKMIELAKARMQKGIYAPIVKKQFHDKQHARNQSGLICSGDQTVALIILNQSDQPMIDTLRQLTTPLFLSINPTHGMRISSATTTEKLEIRTEDDFDILLKILPPPTAHIFGAGHVGRALCRQLSILNYRVIQYDNRPDLPGLDHHPYANEVKIIDYENVKEIMVANSDDVVCLVSFSYRDDKVLLRQLYDQPFSYLGVMGSDHKIDTLKQELIEEGISSEALAAVYMPIGLPILSKTAAEIAVSIAGELVRVKNEGLSTGRAF